MLISAALGKVGGLMLSEKDQFTLEVLKLIHRDLENARTLIQKPVPHDNNNFNSVRPIVTVSNHIVHPSI